MRISKKVLVSAGIIGAALLVIFWPDEPIVDRPKAGSAVIAFGDSLVFGIGASEGNDFVSRLERSVGVPIVNAGIPGDTTGSALARLEKDVISEDPKIVIVLLGGNDTLRRIPPEITFSNLEQIIDRIHATGAAVLLLGVRGSIFNDRYEEKFESLAKKKKVSFVSNVLDGLLGKNEYMADGIHPNDAGYAKIAEKVQPILQKMLE